jgi:hypothetical protein
MKRNAKVEEALRSDLPTPSENEVKSAGIRVFDRLQANHGEAPGRAALTFDPAQDGPGERSQRDDRKSEGDPFRSGPYRFGGAIALEASNYRYHYYDDVSEH